MIKFFLLILALSYNCSGNMKNNLSRRDLPSAQNTTISTTDSLSVVCEAFLLGFDEVRLYDKINGDIFKTIQNNEADEVFYSIKVYRQKGDWFLVCAEAMGKTVSGWLQNNSYLATYSRNYSDTLFVHVESNTGDVVYSIEEYFTSPMKIIACKENWVKVEIKDSSFNYIGWVLQSMTCPSPYTTCP